MQTDTYANRNLCNTDVLRSHHITEATNTPQREPRTIRCREKKLQKLENNTVEANEKEKTVAASPHSSCRRRPSSSPFGTLCCRMGCQKTQEHPFSQPLHLFPDRCPRYPKQLTGLKYQKVQPFTYTERSNPIHIPKYTKTTKISSSCAEWLQERGKYKI